MRAVLRHSLDGAERALQNDHGRGRVVTGDEPDSCLSGIREDGRDTVRGLDMAYIVRNRAIASKPTLDSLGQRSRLNLAVESHLARQQGR